MNNKKKFVTVETALNSLFSNDDDPSGDIRRILTDWIIGEDEVQLSIWDTDDDLENLRWK